MKFEFKNLAKNTPAAILFHLFLAAGLFLLLAVFYFYIYLPKSTNHGQTITVPNVEGLPVSQLETELKKRTLRYEVNDSLYSADYPPLTVLRQFPPPGAKVKEGRVIFISVNRINPPSVPVPNLIDGSVVNADAVLRSNQLKRGQIILVPGPFNMVKEIRLNGGKIAPGTRVPKGSVIDLVVMDGGSNTFAMPSVIGYDYEEAKFTIVGSNLSIDKVNLIPLPRDTVGKKVIVIRQKPEVGQMVKVGDVVDLWLDKEESIHDYDDDVD